MDAFTLCLGAIVILLFFCFTQRPKPYSRLPPGPRGLPLFGNIFSMIKEPAQKLFELAKTHGSVFTLCLGPKQVIVVCDYEEMKGILKRKETAGRPHKGVFYQLSEGHGVVLSIGELWTTSRRMLLQYFRESGKNRMEEAISEELNNVVGHLKKVAAEESPIDMTHLLHQSTCNVTCFICFGKLFDYDDQIFTDNIKRMERNFRLLFIVQVLAVFKPWISPLLYFGERIILNNAKTFKVMIKTVINEHVKVLESDKQEEMPSDFIYNFLSVAKEEKKELGENSLYTNKQLLEVMSDMFAAGTETVATTVRWIILYMLEHPEAKDGMQAEMDQVVGRSRLPTWQDKDDLPYSIACIQEVERLVSVAHLSVTHTCLEDFKYKDYVIPKGTDILYNIWAAHHDPKLWSRPDEFIPERFIDEKGKVFRPEYLIPFGTGRRMCPGEMLAKIELFLYTTTLFHTFNFHKVPVTSSLDFNSSSGLTREPRMYQVLISCRD